MTTRSDFLEKINSFMKAHRLSRSRFGKLARHSEGFVYRIEEGGDVKLSTVEEVMEWMERCDTVGLHDYQSQEAYVPTQRSLISPTTRKKRKGTNGKK